MGWDTSWKLTARSLLPSGAAFSPGGAQASWVCHVPAYFLAWQGFLLIPHHFPSLRHVTLKWIMPWSLSYPWETLSLLSKSSSKSKAMFDRFSKIDHWRYTHAHIHTNTHNGILLSHKKEWHFAICNNVDGLGGYHAKWNKSDRERLYDITYMQNLKNKTNEWTKKKDSDIEN